MAVTVNILREHLETDLSDAALTRLLEDAVAELDQRFGDATADVTEIHPVPDGRFLFPARRVTSVTSITERLSIDSTQAVDATYYRLRYNGRAIERIYGSWNYETEVVYTPASEETVRDRVTIDLVQAALTYEGLVKDETAGDFQVGRESAATAYRRERENLMAQVARHRGGRLIA